MKIELDIESTDMGHWEDIQKCPKCNEAAIWFLVPNKNEKICINCGYRKKEFRHAQKSR